MEESILASTSKTRSMDMENLHGLTAKSITDNGKTVSNTGRDIILIHQGYKRRGCGNREEK
jgi:hypothetical protein